MNDRRAEDARISDIHNAVYRNSEDITDLKKAFKQQSDRFEPLVEAIEDIAAAGRVLNKAKTGLLWIAGVVGAVSTIYYAVINGFKGHS